VLQLKLCYSGFRWAYRHAGCVRMAGLQESHRHPLGGAAIVPRAPERKTADTGKRRSSTMNRIPGAFAHLDAIAVSEALCEFSQEPVAAFHPESWAERALQLQLNKRTVAILHNRVLADVY
jgi:hypothetical protein